MALWIVRNAKRRLMDSLMGIWWMGDLKGLVRVRWDVMGSSRVRSRSCENVRVMPM